VHSSAKLHNHILSKMNSGIHAPNRCTAIYHLSFSYSIDTACSWISPQITGSGCLCSIKFLIDLPPACCPLWTLSSFVWDGGVCVSKIFQRASCTSFHPVSALTRISSSWISYGIRKDRRNRYLQKIFLFRRCLLNMNRFLINPYSLQPKKSERLLFGGAKMHLPLQLLFPVSWSRRRHLYRRQRV